MGGEHAVFAVDRHEIAWLDQVEHQLELLLTAVALHVHLGRAPRQYLGSLARQIIDDVRHNRFVSWDGGRRDDDGIVVLDSDVAIGPIGDPGEDRQRLALRTGENDHLLLGREMLDLL